MAGPIADDESARFSESCQCWENYPQNLVRTEALSHSLASVKTRLADDSLYDTSAPSSLFLRDLQQDQDAFPPTRQLKTTEELQRVLQKEKDPWWRFGFLHSQSARDPLLCNKEQISRLLTHHQVMHSFTEFLATFRHRTRALNHAFYRQENYLEDDCPTLRLPKLGRSGFQMQHAFNLLAPERNEVAGPMWRLRHATVYHCLDVETGRLVCFFLKGNRILTSRMLEATKTCRQLLPTTAKTRERSFAASLQVHLIVLEWAVENLSEYIDYMEESVSRRAVKAKAAPVTTIANPTTLAEGIRRTTLPPMSPRRGTLEAVTSRSGTFNTVASRRGTFPAVQQESSVLTADSATMSVSSPNQPPSPIVFRRGSSQTLTGFLRRNSRPYSRQSSFSEKDGGEEEHHKIINNFEHLEKNFSFDQLQGLSLEGDEIDRMLVALHQNKEVVAQIREQYESATQSSAFRRNMKEKEIKSDLSRFLQRVQGIDRQLDLARCRLQALSRVIEKSTQMFESLNQYTSVQSSKAFSLLAQTSGAEMMKCTTEMHHIAMKTKQETLSMHVITVFTLIFLPGTFIAVRYLSGLSGLCAEKRPEGLTLASGCYQTFFSSGVVQWDEDGTLGSEWVLRQEGIKLFLAICLPLMAITIAAWAVMYVFGRRRTQRSLTMSTGESLDGYADEKAMPSLPEASSPGQGPPSGLGILPTGQRL